MSNRNLTDKEKEIKLMPILDYFYNQTLVTEGFAFERNFNTEKQIKGIDVVFKHEGNEYLVDEKCAVRFFEKNNQLKTYCFEIFCSKNKNGDGWFCNNNFYLTTHYCLFYPIADNRNLDNIEKLDMILIEKSKIWQLLNQLGFSTKEEIIKYFHANKYVTQERDYCNINETVKIVQSKTFSEKPINIIIKREELERLSTKKYSYKFVKGEIQ